MDPSVAAALELPELLPTHTSPIRIPGELDVPVTKRIRSILDTPAMQRLRSVSQLGLVSLVYPGATHSRFEHSLGVYRLACEVLKHLCNAEAEFAKSLTADDAKTFLLAALLHDVGHWPYCHPIEDLQFDWVPKHELLAHELICQGSVAEAIRSDFGLAPERVSQFLANDREALARSASTGMGSSRCMGILLNVMNGPVDIDKMDYLQRDSLHAGVPYGRNFDIGRLINSLCVGADGDSLAITEKGKTAAEMMVFARYVMFSEVYWHHTVRSATAMLQRVVYELRKDVEPLHWLEQSDAAFAAECLHGCKHHPEISPLAEALFGVGRRLYKNVAQFNFSENQEVHSKLAGRKYTDLVAVSEKFADALSEHSGCRVSSSQVLIDAPPVKLEVQFRLQVRNKSKEFVSLSGISPVVNSLATEQFDNFVKRVRVFVEPSITNQCQLKTEEVAKMLLQAC